MENKDPLLTIITASFNSEKTISKTIESVLKQTINCFEYIIIDGDSKDNTVSIIKSFEAKFKEKSISYQWVSEKDTGIYNAFNKGVSMSSGKWISFLGSDDEYLNNAVESYQKEISKKDFIADFVYSNIQKKNQIVYSELWKWKKFKRRMTIAHVGGFHNKEYFNKYGFFNESYHIAADYELLLRAKSKLKAHQINIVTVLMGDEGVSNNQIKKVYKETTRAKIEAGNVNVFIAKFDFFIWMLKFRIKKIINALVR